MSCCAMQGFQMFATAWFGAGHRVFEVMGESWSWVGSVDVTAVSRTEGSQSRGPGKTHREVLTSVGQLRHTCACVCGCVTYAVVMQQGTLLMARQHFYEDKLYAVIDFPGGKFN